MTKNNADWKAGLEQAVRAAKANVIGWRNIKEAYHGILVTTALAAFGDDAKATFFIEGHAPVGNIPRPDLILLHPQVGVLVVENKGIALADVHGVENTTLRLVRDGRLKEEDPFHQAGRIMFGVRDLAARRVNLVEALFIHSAAFPRISREEFEKKFHAQWPDETLFADACTDPAKFKSHVLGFSEFSNRKAKRSSKLSRHAHDAVMTILSGTGVMYAPRRSYIEETDTALIGVQVQDMELALKEATQQQKEYGRSDLRGHHRMFRGVAGSGKSIMLALSVAQTLTNYRNERATLFGSTERKPRALVVCFNRALVPYLRQKVEDRFERVAWDKPADDELTVTHFEGLVRISEAKEPSLKSGLDYSEKSNRARAMCAAMDKLDKTAADAVMFDAVYVDEAQDLLPEEFEFLLKLARKNDKGGQTVILFYDNAQNIYGVPAPVWSKLGINIVGRTVFLDQCLRNTRETLLFAFNVLVGSFAPEGERVTTRTFADVESLRQRGLIEEKDGRFDIFFTKRSGPLPFVQAYANRETEVDGVVEAVRRLLLNHKVLPSDILILYNSHKSYSDLLGPKFKKALGDSIRLRFVDRAHDANKDLPLLEDGALTVSTIASAKGYDAPVVLLLGVDELDTSNEDRATFYVGATRAKLHLVVTGVKRDKPTLLNEVIVAATALAGREVTESRETTPEAELEVQQSAVKVASTPAMKIPAKQCRQCQSQRLHAQSGKFGYFFRCIDCTENTPMDMTCPACGKRAKIRKVKNQFFRECKCGHGELYHENVPLGSLFE